MKRKKKAGKISEYSIRKKLLIIMISIIVSMLVLLGLSNYAISRKMLTQVSVDASRKIIAQLEQSLDAKIQLLDDFMVKEAFETEIYRALNPIYEEMSYKSQTILKTYSNNLINYNKYIKIVLIEDNNQKCFQNTAYNWKLGDNIVENMLSTENAKALWGKNYWSPCNEELVFASRAVFDGNTMEQVGVVSIGIDQAFFTESYEDLLNEKGNDIIILNQDYEVLLNSNEEVGDIARMLVEKYELSEDTEQEFYYRDNNYLFTWRNLEKNGIRVMNLVNKKIISDRAVQMLAPFWYIALASILLAASLVIWLYRDISSKLLALLGRIQSVENGDFSVKEEPGGEDEISEVIRAFNEMSKKMTSLLDSITEEKIQKKNAQLKAVQFEYDALQAKINPHFLYNTLESINSLAKLNGDREVADSVRLLGNYLRQTISTKRKFVTLEEEVQNICKYIELQNMSFGNRIHLFMEMDEILMDTLVPRLILQPLVENAIVHGLEPKPGAGSIRVVSRCEEKDMLIEIEDNGIGISEKWLYQDLSFVEDVPEEEKQNHTKVGLQAVHKRIRILYGDQYGIRIAQGKKEGTIVTVKLPVIFEGEADEQEL